MRRSSNIWADVAELVAAGKVPVLTLGPSSRIVIPKGPIGRPRVNPPGQRYAGWKLLTPTGFPMRCRNRGCSKRLRKNDVLVCSEYCRNELVRFCESVQQILSGDAAPESFPSHFRSSRLNTLTSRRRR